MAKSAKAKKEKKKDFQKAKLKVGKTRAKADNFTDTSFKARRISVLQQSLATNAPSTITQFNHHLGLLSHKSEQQKLQSLSHLTSVLASGNANGFELPQPASVIIGKVQPLIRDQSGAVRSQVVKLLRCLPNADVRSHADSLLLWIRLGMTNLSSSIRMGALDALEWLCEAAGHEAVTCAGGWTKTLKCFGGILGWDQVAPAKPKDGKTAWTSTPNATAKSTIDSKLLLKTLGVLTIFLEKGLIPNDQEEAEIEEVNKVAKAWPLSHVQQHMLPIHQGVSDSFAYLDLFSAFKDEESAAMEDWEERAHYFDEKWRKSFDEGVMKVVREGGGIGRAAIGLHKVLKGAREVAEETEEVV